MDFLFDWPLPRLEALYRQAKKGAYPFFRNPRDMMKLRSVLETKRTQERLAGAYRNAA